MDVPTKPCLAPALRPLRPGHDAVRQVLDRDVVLQGADPAADADAGLVHGVAAAGNQVMPPREVATLPDEAIGAGRGQPVDLPDGLGGQLDAVGDTALPSGIIAAAAGAGIV